MCNDFGLCQSVTTATHGKSLTDKVFVSYSDIFRCSVLKSLLKTKHMAILLSPASSSGSVAYTAVCYSRFAAARQLLASGPAECRQRPSILEVRYYC